MEGIIAVAIVLALLNIGFAFLRSQWKKSGNAAARSSPRPSDKPTTGTKPAGLLPPMETRLRAEEVTGKHHSYIVQRIEAKGRFPIPEPIKLGFTASILDVTEVDNDGQSRPMAVVSSLEDYQESDTTCFEDRQEFGVVQLNQGWFSWTSVLSVIPETLVPPRKGDRKYQVNVVAYDVERQPTVRHGFLLDGKPLATWTHEFAWKHESDGWQEHSEKRRESEELTVRLAVAMGFADGSLHDSEAATIKQWIARRLELLRPESRDNRKQEFNEVVKQAYRVAKSGKAGASRIVDRLKEVGDASARMEAVELCLDILAADGQAADSELKAVNAIAKRLDVDVEQFEQQKDKRLVDLSGGLDGEVDYYALLNIDRKWGRDQIKAHLNRLYGRWNARAESLADADGRKQAERMLDLIASARRELVS
jgi:tellurite resistance protein